MEFAVVLLVFVVCCCYVVMLTELGKLLGLGTSKRVTMKYCRNITLSYKS